MAIRTKNKCHYHLNKRAMSKYQTIRAIRAEIGRLNREIDIRIIRGVSYRRESLRHKILSSELAELVNGRSAGWFSRSFRFVSMFMF